MNNLNNNLNKDEKALEALLAAAFRLNFSENISDEEAKKYFQQPSGLSKEDREAIESWGNAFIEKLIEGQKTTLDESQEEIEVDKELEQEYFAMNRDKDGNDIDEETRNKIDEERRRALEEENKDHDTDH